MKKLVSLQTICYLLLAISYLLFATSAFADGSETICTPVYGMANSCAEHAVVDTGLDSSTLLNASALSYILGLAAFVKAKRTRGVPLSGAKRT